MPDSASPSASSRLRAEANQRLAALAAQVDQQAKQAADAADALRARVASQIAEQLAGMKHTYAVFAVGDPPHPMVLRDLESLDGRPPLSAPTDDFAAALAQARRLASNLAKLPGGNDDRPPSPAPTPPTATSSTAGSATPPSS